VPCTYLDGGDYVYGSRDKLTEALTFIRDHVGYSLLAIVNSPGAALIGDDLEGIARSVLGGQTVVAVETPGFSSDVCAGFEAGAVALLDALHPPKRAALPRTVNLLGLSIFQKYFAGDLAEIRRLLGLCGVTVNCALCAGDPPDKARDIAAAGLNVVIRPEYGLATAEYLRARYGTPYYVCDGAPIGFAATEGMLADICALAGGDPAPGIEDSERARANAYVYISRVNSLTGLPKGVRVSVEGTYADIYGYFRFFTEYLGMLPEAAAVFCPRADYGKPKWEAFLRRHGLADIHTRDMFNCQSELVFASGATISRLRNAGRKFVGVENALPGLGYLDVIPKTHLGVSGALLLVEQVLNSLLF
jgi:nitrogenase molybdenum-iron protein alpha/beta subunit